MTKTATRAHRVFPDADHDHDDCINAALSDAAELCAGRGVRLTPTRRRVLEILWQSHRPLGAYAVLEELGREGRAAAPPTVYRALEFLLDNGLVHRIASLNAFIGCSHPGHPGSGQFLMCEACGDALELHNVELERAIHRATDATGFSVSRHTVEIAGRCPACQSDGPA